MSHWHLVTAHPWGFAIWGLPLKHWGMVFTHFFSISGNCWYKTLITANWFWWDLVQGTWFGTFCKMQCENYSLTYFPLSRFEQCLIKEPCKDWLWTWTMWQCWIYPVVVKYVVPVNLYFDTVKYPPCTNHHHLVAVVQLDKEVMKAYRVIRCTALIILNLSTG